MTSAPQYVNAGQRPFTRSTLAIYDPLVLELTCRWIWRCPTERILSFYEKHLSANHLEVGVGTGFFPDRSAFPAPAPRLGLLDLNPNCLERTAARLSRYAPETYRANVLDPIDLDVPRFDSLALNYVLHCLPGALPQKGVVFKHLKALLNPGGVLFGATVLNDAVPGSGLARAFMRLCNAVGVFSNALDTKDALVQALERHLRGVHVEVVGCVALFSGHASPETT